MEIDDPTTAVGALDAAAAAAATVLAALPTATPESTSGQMQIWERYPALSRLQPALIDAPMCGAYCCAGAPRVCMGPSARVDSVGKLVCELCGRRLSKVKHHRPCGVGRACAPRCKPRERAVDDAARPAVAAPVAGPHQSRKRRATSDPGEPLNLTRLRTRAPRPATIPTVKKARVQPTPVDATLLLDQAHARRLALIAAEENRGAHGTSNASAVVWQ